MKGLYNSVSYCVKERKPCVGWIDKYFRDCLCNLSDELSFAFGFISLFCWGVAEIPQIITNFRTKSSHGVSLLFLLTWILGDAFNLLGCLLEPATLPTQYYTAVLYTTSTIVLVLQSLYYDHVYRLWKHKKSDTNEEIEEAKNPLKPAKSDDLGIPIPSGAIRSSPRRDFYYTSARSLAGSATPPVRSNMWTTRSGPSTVGLDNDSSSEDDEAIDQHSHTQPKPIPRSAGYGAFLATSISLPRGTKASMVAYLGYSGRKLLQETTLRAYGFYLSWGLYRLAIPARKKEILSLGQRLFATLTGKEEFMFNQTLARHPRCRPGEKLYRNLEHGTEDSVYGQLLGWMMAAIYMGGRIPQICLNIKRGSVEGLNPLMFIFALIANVAYVGSILVRSTEWEKIKANMPWLLDAVVCVGLDLFIILQYVYYKYIRQRISSSAREEYGDYSEASKPLVS